MHVSLYVTNIQESINFYSKFFNQDPEKIKPGYAKYLLNQPPLIISFVENKDRVQSNFGHLGFQVETLEELQLRTELAKSLNLISKEEKNSNCCYAKQDKFWVNDPDNIQWEVYYFHEDAEFNDPHFHISHEVNCCTVSSHDVKNSCGCNASIENKENIKTEVCC